MAEKEKVTTLRKKGQLMRACDLERRTKKLDDKRNTRFVFVYNSSILFLQSLHSCSLNPRIKDSEKNSRLADRSVKDLRPIVVWTRLLCTLNEGFAQGDLSF